MSIGLYNGYQDDKTSKSINYDYQHKSRNATELIAMLRKVVPTQTVLVERTRQNSTYLFDNKGDTIEPPDDDFGSLPGADYYVLQRMTTSTWVSFQPTKTEKTLTSSDNPATFNQEEQDRGQEIVKTATPAIKNLLVDAGFRLQTKQDNNPQTSVSGLYENAETHTVCSFSSDLTIDVSCVDSNDINKTTVADKPIFDAVKIAANKVNPPGSEKYFSKTDIPVGIGTPVILDSKTPGYKVINILEVIPFDTAKNSGGESVRAWLYQKGNTWTVFAWGIDNAPACSEYQKDPDVHKAFLGQQCYIYTEGNGDGTPSVVK